MLDANFLHTEDPSSHCWFVMGFSRATSQSTSWCCIVESELTLSRQHLLAVKQNLWIMLLVCWSCHQLDCRCLSRRPT